ncbi:MAG: hypothetical protein HFJ58_00005 [Clostridia bacterium]|nr:hypothetical protein [Clostridia bacterium]
MKKLLSFVMIFAIVLCSVSVVFAQDEYSFDLQYTGTIVKNVEKDAVVLLTGVNGTPHTSVQIKVDITGPATPKILATDSAGTEYDIAQLGYWGPPSGFQVGGDFVNRTPIKATFIEEGSYTIKLSLVDLANGNAVITTKTFDIEVYEDVPGGNVVSNVIDNAVVEGNTLEELPKTGTSVVEYVMYIIAIVLIISIIGMYINRKRVNG